ncbi:hypothetical protein BKA70DRAFT_1438817 [Coprinopsis sp. MPI-PUGE-AT-0042]|nr:hypothetical protein BKA70DRAFT_1438817 [Coprinopsis sp. MPI-PUGE-AT-0042]
MACQRLAVPPRSARTTRNTQVGKGAQKSIWTQAGVRLEGPVESPAKKPGVYESLQTSSPLFVDESIPDRPWPANFSPGLSTSSPFKYYQPQMGRRMHSAKALGLEAMQKGIPDSLFPSGETVTAILPNHSLDDITGSGSLTSPSPTPSKTTRKEKAFALATLYFMIPRLLTDTPALPKPHLHLPPGFLANQLPFEGLNPSLSFTSASPADPRFYQGEGEVTPATSSAAEPSLPVPERKLGADAGERETA